MLGSIRHRLVVLVLLVAVPLVLAMVLVVDQLAETQRRAQVDYLFASTRALVAAVDAEINRHIAAAQALAASRTLRAGDLAEFQREAGEALQSLPNTSLALVDPAGQQLVNTLRPFGTPLPRMTTRAPIEAAVETRRAQTSDIVVGQIAGRPVAGVFVPVIRDDKITHLIVVVVNPDHFLQILRNQKIPEGWLSGIIDRGGNFVARSLDHPARLGTPASEGWRRARAGVTEGFFTNRSLEGTPFHSVFVNSALTGWSVSIGVSDATLFAPIVRSLWAVGLGSAALIVVSVALALWAGRRIVEPMRSLGSAAVALTRGEQINVQHTGLSEVDHAFDAFNSATAALLDRERRRTLVVNELNHRVKNTLAVIQSIAMLTARSATSVADYSRTFAARLMGLARTHDLLTERDWDGALITDVVWNELKPYDDGQHGVCMRGDAVRLTPKMTVALGMILHELVTNAAKYGSLSDPNGRIDVAFARTVADGVARLRFVWDERGGPAVSRPERDGFGSLLIAQNVKAELRGELTVEWRPHGLHCVIEFPHDEGPAEFPRMNDPPPQALAPDAGETPERRVVA